jgi:hypothetical protein
VQLGVPVQCPTASHVKGRSAFCKTRQLVCHWLAALPARIRIHHDKLQIQWSGSIASVNSTVLSAVVPNGPCLKHRAMEQRLGHIVCQFDRRQTLSKSGWAEHSTTTILCWSIKQRELSVWGRRSDCDSGLKMHPQHKRTWGTGPKSTLLLGKL